MTENRETHAVVLGASMAGLLAARVLADHYDRVTVIDRDPLPTTAGHRRGVPHDRHLHGLHPRGLQILDELFPGFAADLERAGAVSGDMQATTRFLLSGSRFRQAPLGLRGLLCTRPFLEGHVRARVRALPQVRFLTAAVSGLTSSHAGSRITGVRITPDRCPQRSIAADLVVDATGRGSATPRRLAELGYEQPAQERVEIGIGYATRAFRLRPGALGHDVLIVNGATPANSRSGVMAAQEGGQHVVTLSGILGDHPPTDLAGFTAFAASLNFPDIADALAGAQPLDDGATFRFPASTRRRYELLPGLPAGLLVTGDAVCSFNPVYGQGMTVAALEAITLRGLLAQDPQPDPRAWFRAIAHVIDAPWQVAVGADLAFPEVAGTRTTQVRLVNSYLPRLHAAAATDASLAAAFIRVLGLLDRPESLMRPDRLARVALAHLRPGARDGQISRSRDAQPVAVGAPGCDDGAGPGGRRRDR